MRSKTVVGYLPVPVYRGTTETFVTSNGFTYRIPGTRQGVAKRDH
jgi:hypothetical protein